MTVLSCVAVGLAFVIAVSLLVLASVLIGWAIPISRRPPDPPEGSRLQPRAAPLPAVLPTEAERDDP